MLHGIVIENATCLHSTPYYHQSCCLTGVTFSRVIALSIFYYCDTLETHPTASITQSLQLSFIGSLINFNHTLIYRWVASSITLVPLRVEDALIWVEPSRAEPSWFWRARGGQNWSILVDSFHLVHYSCTSPECCWIFGLPEELPGFPLPLPSSSAAWSTDFRRISTHGNSLNRVDPTAPIRRLRRGCTF